MPNPDKASTGVIKLFVCARPLPVAALDDRERVACLRLIRSSNVGPVTFRELINAFGGAAAALDALPELAAKGGGKSFRICPKSRAEDELAPPSASARNRYSQSSLAIQRRWPRSKCRRP